MRAYHYNPSELDSEEYQRIEAAITALGDTAASDQMFPVVFNSVSQSRTITPLRTVELRVLVSSQTLRRMRLMHWMLR